MISLVVGLQLDEGDGVLLVVLCCLLLLELGEVGLCGWLQLIVYLDVFCVQCSYVDVVGVLYEWDDELIGEFWDSGLLILLWVDIQVDIVDLYVGYCVVVYEMVYKIDVLDGVIDGMLLLLCVWQKQWVVDFQWVYDGFCEQVDWGWYIVIDLYVLEVFEEFFVVVIEYYFFVFVLLDREMLEVVVYLWCFYGVLSVM